jgi:hypothetical protein
MRPGGDRGPFVYHVNCFSCSACGRRLYTGQQYAMFPLPTGEGVGSWSESPDNIRRQPFIYCRDDYKRLLLGSSVRRTTSSKSLRHSDYNDVIVGSHRLLTEGDSSADDRNLSATGCQSSTVSGPAVVTTANGGRKTSTRQRKRRSVCGVSGTTAVAANLVPSVTSRPEFDMFNVSRQSTYTGSVLKFGRLLRTLSLSSFS